MEAVGKLREVWVQVESYDSFKKMIGSQTTVLAQFQKIFSFEHLDQLREEEYLAFLLEKNNHHWTGLHRQGPSMCANMERLRGTLKLLLDENRPIENRIDSAIGGIKGMGKAVATAILHIVHPNKYGVWNGTSEGALKTLDFWPKFERGSSMGKRYVEINTNLIRLAAELETNLWTLDGLFWAMQKIYEDEDSTEDPFPEPGHPTLKFGLERHLHEFLRDNWKLTSLSNEWNLYTEDGNPEAGFEFPCGIGRIDLLAKHKKKSEWLVIELKRDKTSDTAVGQILRYIGWVKKHLAEQDEEVLGLIIALQADEKLQYSLISVPHIQFQLYKVDFSLLPSKQE